MVIVETSRLRISGFFKLRKKDKLANFVPTYCKVGLASDESPHYLIGSVREFFFLGFCVSVVWRLPSVD